MHISPVFALTTFIATNPGAVVWFLGGLCFIISVLAGLIWSNIAGRISALEEADKQLKGEVAGVKEVISSYEEHIGVGDSNFKLLYEKVSKHMEEEETTVWGGIRNLSTQIAAMDISNVKAHADIVLGFSPRLATIETKLDAVEKKMPNGELKEAIRLLQHVVEMNKDVKK